MEKIQESDILYADNHLLIVNKKAKENVQGDKSGDLPLVEKVRNYIRDKYQKPGNVFCGLVHRLDRPVSGVIVFARTSKALERMNKQFATSHPKKVYWAVVENEPKQAEGRLVHHLVRNEQQNKSYVYDEPRPNSKECRLSYRKLLNSKDYTLLEVELETGRHHQIRAQLSKMGCVIKGDLKYGAKRSNPDGSIHLHARSLTFEHPTSKEIIEVVAPVPTENLWKWFEEELS